MRVDILNNGKVIGHCNLAPIDPSMGVAGGRFDPTPEYDPSFHAFVVDGDYKDIAGVAQLSAHSAEFGPIRCKGVAIEDFNESLNEITVVILGMAYPEYEIAFAFPGA
ncbi:MULTISPECIES: hypothetical protein [Rhizobium]|uniref:Uncharacterized protein n=1 Tax=Rhizobium sophoriradicis TaxID=1535245 RepID=A0A2A5KW04_9HYPH|nr:MULTISPECIES: hypothetical protein [Rhizobium]ARQ57262.1 hypothetical protein Kim5_CH01159 [Rhizobium sp. Kim5]PCK81256.1 hypothetical protein CPT34_08405 [Rhizobium sophoriradicis]UWU35373.1 hypothetical protein N2597_03365 [Rhizobium leguminosarum bv. phaseoli]